MKWEGVHDDLSSVGNSGFRELFNVSFYVDGELRRRPGHYNRFAQSGDSVMEYDDPINGKHYVISDSSAGTLDSVKASDGTVTSLATSLSDARRGTFARSGGRIYFANGFDKMKVVEDATGSAADAGISAPSGDIGDPTLSSGDCTDGSHRVRYRYYNSKTGYYSNPSGAISATTSSQKMTFGIASTADDILWSTDSKVDQIKLEATLANGTVYYVAATVSNSATTVDFDMSDLDLELQPTLGGGTGYAPPPLFDIVAEHRGRLFGIGAETVTVSDANPTNTSTTVTSASNAFSTEWPGRLIRFPKATDSTKRYRIDSVAHAGSLELSEAFDGTGGAQSSQVLAVAPDTLYWSSPTLPEAWDSTSQARRVLQNYADEVTGLASYYDDLYIFGQNTVRRLVYTTDPAGGKLEHLPTDLGVWNQHCIVEADGRLYGWGRNGVWYLRGLLPVHVSKPIDDTFDDRADKTASAKYHASYDPDEGSLSFWYVASGDTEPQEALCLDAGQWSIRKWDKGITASASVADDSGSSHQLICDENDYSWFQSREHFDGVAYTANASVTAAAGSTTTVVNTAESLSDCVGCTVYRPSDGTVRVITAYTGNSFTTSAWGSTPSVGEAFYIGRISTSGKSKWIPGGGVTEKKFVQLGVGFIPESGAGSLDISVYSDFGGAYQLTEFSDDVHAQGVSFDDGDTAATVSYDSGDNQDGFAPIPCPTDWKRVWSFGFTADEPAGTLALTDIGLATKDRRFVDE